MKKSLVVDPKMKPDAFGCSATAAPMEAEGFRGGEGARGAQVVSLGARRKSESIKHRYAQ